MLRTSQGLAFALVAVCTPALAYVGPGMGAGLLATALGVAVSALLALVAILYYPLKRMLRNRRLGQNQADDPAGHNAES